MSDSTAAASSSPELAELVAQIGTVSEKKQLQATQQIAGLGDPGIDALMEVLVQQVALPIVAGKAYQLLWERARGRAFLADKFPQGIVPLSSECGIDYFPLQQALVKREFQEADLLTIRNLCAAVGPATVARKWLYFTEVTGLPVADLRTIDTLWRVHSEGKFGFSVQRRLWLAGGKNYEGLWMKIGWKSGNRWTRYPGEFDWTMAAPVGHLPLSNQLRGVRSFASLLAHPAWQEN